MANEEDKDEEYDYRMPVHIAPTDYITTTLVNRSNMTLADVHIGVYFQTELAGYERRLGFTLNELQNRVEIIDPLARLREENKEGIVNTLVPYDSIIELCRRACVSYEQ